MSNFSDMVRALMDGGSVPDDHDGYISLCMAHDGEWDLLIRLIGSGANFKLIHESFWGGEIPESRSRAIEFLKTKMVGDS